MRHAFIAGFIVSVLVTATYLLSITSTWASDKQHAISLFGAAELPSNFTHFPYARPDAPKGGIVKLSAVGGFDNLNGFTFKGNTAAGLSVIYDRLFIPNFDEPSAYYGLVAHAISYPADFSSATFYLRKEAQFHDGTPITADDVIWSLEALKRAHPGWRAYYADVTRTEAPDKHIVHFKFRMKGNRELPLILGQLPILPKHYWTSNGRDITATTLEPPLASGPYKISKVDAGRTLTFTRVKDYWGRNLNVNRGQNNFDTIEYLYFGDDTVAFEALKNGTVHFRAENTARNWATGYDIAAVRDGQLIREEKKIIDNKGMQAFVFNTRRALFDEPRLREAFNLAFDFEWTNKTFFYNQYARTNSYFEGTELAAQGLPSARERALLEPYADMLPPQVLTTAFANPTGDGSGNIRSRLSTARDLLKSAGFVIEEGKLTRGGKPIRVEFLIVQTTFERIIAPYLKNLARLGIDAQIRLVDAAQYQNRITEYDFDIIVDTIPQSLSPGNEQRDFWSSAAADQPGGRNRIGIKNPVIDALINKIIFADSRVALVAATRALDRVLLWNHYVVPQWHAPKERLAFWRGIVHPSRLPRYSLGFPNAWWRE